MPKRKHDADDEKAKRQKELELRKNKKDSSTQGHHRAPNPKSFSTALPVTMNLAALAQALNKPRAYAPENKKDYVQELANNASANLGLGMDMDVAPTPFGTMKSAGVRPNVSKEEVTKNPNNKPTTIYYEDGTKEVVLNANYNHSYFVKGSIEGEDVTFLVDTGASSVSIPWRLANAMGFDKKKCRASTARTANGIVQTYETIIDHLKIGDIELRFVHATVNQGDTSEEILLGMSALKKLEFAYSNEKLYLRQRAG
jgi:aspartyl protease family protein